MKIKTIVSAVMALSLLSGGFAFADDHDHGDNDRGRGNPHDRDHHDNRRDFRHEDYRDGRRGDHRDERGAGPGHAWHRGDRLPVEYRSRQYVVDDWRGHHLSAPPRGYHWVQSGNDYVLVAISTGIIMNFLLGN